jgi:hypothetical protein
VGPIIVGIMEGVGPRSGRGSGRTCCSGGCASPSSRCVSSGGYKGAGSCCSVQGANCRLGNSCFRKTFFTITSIRLSPTRHYKIGRYTGICLAWRIYNDAKVILAPFGDLMRR